MVLPQGVNKASGLLGALREIGVAPKDTVGVGDAENDEDFLALCGYSAAVANALPRLKRQVDVVTAAREGAGVAELVKQLLNGNARVCVDGCWGLSAPCSLQFFVYLSTPWSSPQRLKPLSQGADFSARLKASTPFPSPDVPFQDGENS